MSRLTFRKKFAQRATYPDTNIAGAETPRRPPFGRLIQPRHFAGCVAAILAVMAMTGAMHVSPLEANNDLNRVLSIYNIHNKETVTVTYKRNGKYQPSAMKKLNWVMRDWRRNEATRMDPKLIDIIWKMHSELGSKKPVHLISGYRSRKTNSSLRRKRGGQARNSRHILGKAADIHFPDIPVRQLRYSALVMERGGVGYYPTSALPFVHVDTGRVRHWPRIGRWELALLTRGRSKHIPKGGRPVTKADYRRAKSQRTRLARRIAAFYKARRTPADTARTVVASATPKLPRDWSVPEPTVAARPKRRPTPQAAEPPTPRAPQTQTAALTDWKAPTVRVNEGLFDGLDTAPRAAQAPSRTEPSTRAKAARPNTPTRPDFAADRLPSPILPDPATAAPKDLIAVLAEENPRETLPVPAPRPARRLASLGDGGIAALLDRDDAPERRTPNTALPTPRGPSVDERDVLRPENPNTWFQLSGWATAPGYDDEHEGELSYRPFPVAPFLTAAPTIDDPSIARLVHPDLAGTRDLVGRSEEEISLRFKPGVQYAELLWSDGFIADDAARVLTSDPALKGKARLAVAE